jgi:hypothetical protein
MRTAGVQYMQQFGQAAAFSAFWKEFEALNTAS